MRGSECTDRLAGTATVKTARTNDSSTDKECITMTRLDEYQGKNRVFVMKLKNSKPKQIWICQSIQSDGYTKE
jgi:hypothetical protein